MADKMDNIWEITCHNNISTLNQTTYQDTIVQRETIKIQRNNYTDRATPIGL